MKKDGLGDQQLRRWLSAPATAAKNSQPGKTVTPPAAACFDGELFGGASSPLFVAFDVDAPLAETRVDRGQQVFGDGSFGERQELRFVETGLRALRFRIELRMDSISSPKNSMRTGRSDLGRVDVQNAAAAGELAGHFDQVHLRVADAGEMSR